jgi:hypothetical protein
MSRLISFALILAMVGCAQRLTSLIPTGPQSTMPNATKPAEAVTAYVAFKNDSGQDSLFTVLWSYAVHPLWHEEAASCVEPGKVWHTHVVYNLDDKKFRRGPQIRFVSNPRCTGRSFKNDRVVSFYGMKFDPNANFDVRFRTFPANKLCARGGGNDEVCDPK